MIIDAHAHINAPDKLYYYQSRLISARGAHGRFDPGLTEESVAEKAAETISRMDQVGTDVQLISPRPFTQMHAQEPTKIVHWWIETNNDVIAQQTRLHPDRLKGVAGLPITPTEPLASAFDELDRCINDLGFVGVLLNPDTGEGDGRAPTLGDEYWYPLWERLVALDVPAHIHSAGCRNDRESYSEHFITEESIAILSLLNSRALLDFPDLRIVVSHGGGSVPYQIGRWRAARLHPILSHGQALDESFDESLRRLWFDTVLHEPLSLELLFRVVGPDRCVFATERPGSASVADPKTGRQLDDLRPVIEGMEWLTAEDKAAIFADNARHVFGLT